MNRTTEAKKYRQKIWAQIDWLIEWINNEKHKWKQTKERGEIN